MNKKHPPCEVAIKQPSINSKTVIVIGNGRGGTSAIAGAVHLLGVRMVETGEELNSEDFEIVRCYQNFQKHGHIECVKRIGELIENRNSRYSVWGWKDPAADLYLEGVIGLCRNPHFIFIFRNLFDIAMSHVATKSGTIEVAIDVCLNRYLRYWKLLQKFSCPTLMVSYETALVERKETIKRIISFLGISPTRNQITDAVNFLNPKGGYSPPSAKNKFKY